MEMVGAVFLIQTVKAVCCQVQILIKSHTLICMKYYINTKNNNTNIFATTEYCMTNNKAVHFWVSEFSEMRLNFLEKVMSHRIYLELNSNMV